jgi:predicted HTH transcriptional regulator
MFDLDTPPTNKLRKVVFKPFTGLTKEQKLSIVGSLIGVTNKIHSDDVYDVMLQLHDDNKKITIKRISELLGVSSRTIHRHMCDELKREKELLNQQL